MPESRQRGKQGKQKKLSTADKQRIYDSYLRKVDEYSEMDENQLVAIRDSKTLKGTYLSALLQALQIKQTINNKIQEHGAFAD